MAKHCSRIWNVSLLTLKIACCCDAFHQNNGSVPLVIVIGATAVGAVGAGVFFIWKKIVNKAIEDKKKKELKERRERAQAQSKAKSSGVRGIYDTHDSMVQNSVANIPRNRSANNKKNKARRKGNHHPSRLLVVFDRVLEYESLWWRELRVSVCMIVFGPQRKE